MRVIVSVVSFCHVPSRLLCHGSWLASIGEDVTPPSRARPVIVAAGTFVSLCHVPSRLVCRGSWLSGIVKDATSSPNERCCFVAFLRLIFFWVGSSWRAILSLILFCLQKSMFCVRFLFRIFSSIMPL